MSPPEEPNDQEEINKAQQLLEYWLHKNKCKNPADMLKMLESIHKTSLLEEQIKKQNSTESRLEKFYKANEDLLHQKPINIMMKVIKDKYPEVFKTIPKDKLRVFAYTILNSKKTTPILHQRVLPVIDGFLESKRMLGTEEEKQLYSKMSVEQFITRLISNRPLCFMNPGDTFLLDEDITINLEQRLNLMSKEQQEKLSKKFISITVGNKQLYMTIEDVIKKYPAQAKRFTLKKDRLYNADPFDAFYNEDGDLYPTTNLETYEKDKSKGKDSKYSKIPLDDPFPRELLPLGKYISYEEMQISAHLGISSPALFINKGGRFNKGIPEQKEDFIHEGIITAQVGARFEVPGVMEYQHMLITPQQNTTKNGYGETDVRREYNQALGPHWAKFYGITHFPTYREAKLQYDNDQVRLRAKELGVNIDDPKYIKVGGTNAEPILLNVEAYKARLRSVIETFLVDADQKAAVAKKKAYVHATGLGIGVWAKDKAQQTQLMLDVYAEVLKDHEFQNISDIDFSYFDQAKKFDDTRVNGVGFNDGKGRDDIGYIYTPKRNGEKIKIHFSNNDPQGYNSTHKTREYMQDKLHFTQIAWDGGSRAGNEYYRGNLSGSGDPAAACNSMFPELHSRLNPCNNGSRVSYCSRSSNTLARLARNNNIHKKAPYIARTVQPDTAKPPKKPSINNPVLFHPQTTPYKNHKAKRAPIHHKRKH